MTLLLDRGTLKSAVSLPIHIVWFFTGSLKSCLCCKLGTRATRSYKKLDEAKRRFTGDLDIVNLLKTIRQSKIYLNTRLNPPQKALM